MWWEFKRRVARVVDNVQHALTTALARRTRA
jgi:hypothetical protein